jgi:hypothetical protein
VPHCNLTGSPGHDEVASSLISPVAGSMKPGTGMLYENPTCVS